MDLLWEIARRDFIVRYRGLIFGALWSLLRPLVMSLALFMVFGIALDLAEGNRAAYFLLILSGWIPWQIFSATMMETGQSLAGNSSLLTRSRFPLWILPVASSLINLMDALVAALMLYVLSILIYGFSGQTFIGVLCFLILSYLIALGFGLAAAALHTRFRDLLCLQPLWMQALFCLSPIGFSMKNISSEWNFLFLWHPLGSAMEGIRSCLVPGQGGTFEFILVSSFCALVFLFLGGLIFQLLSETNREQLL